MYMYLFRYASDADIKISLKGLNAGIKDLQIRGDLRVILRPLIPMAPLIGGVTVFFLTNPVSKMFSSFAVVCQSVCVGDGDRVQGLLTTIFMKNGETVLILTRV
jgi:hypothetical protein